MLDMREPVVSDEKTQSAKPRGGRGRTIRKNAEPGLKIEPLFCRPGEDPFAKVEWEKRKASIVGDKGEVIFEQDDVEAPKTWSMLATNVVASKYFYGGLGTEQRETSVRQLVHRVARTIADWGLNDGYFASPEDAETFYTELCHICVHQYASFNSPVWFNVGLFQVYGHVSPSRTSYCWDRDRAEIAQTRNTYERPQASACFIQSVDDSMEDIMRLAGTEAILFKYGSGTGTDLSSLRSSREKLSGGGTPSGPLSFMRVFDQVAAVIKSGGKTRRAAKMQSLRVDHPDIAEFVECKVREEKKARSLIAAGYDGSFGGEAYDSVMFQNSNLSVRVTDDFMRAAENDATFETRTVCSGEVSETLKAREMLRKMAESAHTCGDPGIQYDTTINRWHTCPESGRINASNPCSEFMFLDDSACNLSSVNLMKFVDDSGRFDLATFRHTVRLMTVAQDILVDSASYPTDRIALHSHAFRPLGLGYANLGALIMRLGLPYDSAAGRAFASAVTATMTGYAYRTSQEMAAALGPFEEYGKNSACMAEVMGLHHAAVKDLDTEATDPLLRRAAEKIWDEVMRETEATGFRNSQTTLLAPTGTIGFMMDCDTTGVEPDIALVKYKQLAGGGMMKIVNRTLRPALAKLGYSEDDMDAIARHVDEKDTVEGAAALKAEHLKVFDCAFKPRKGNRCISYKAHLKMMAAVQPFLSGAISKTVNLPAEATVKEIMQVFVDGWKMGLKSVAVYRDGSKNAQPLNTSDTSKKDSQTGPVKEVVVREPFRKRMPATRQSLTHKFEVAGHEGYLTVGIYEDGTPGELFITMAKEGSTVGGTMDSFGTAISLCLQYGVPMKELCQKFAHSRFEPSGFTQNPDIPMAKSIVDYIFRWLEHTFPAGTVKPFVPGVGGAQSAPGPKTPVVVAAADAPPTQQGEPQRLDEQFNHFMADAPACDSCGAITVRNGACYRCYNCGNSMGCS